MNIKAYQIGTLSILALAMVLCFQNCGSNGMTPAISEPNSKSSLTKEVQDLRVLIDSLNDEDLSCSLDSDCKALPVGLRACGGPTEFIVGSILNARHSEVLAISELHRQKTKELLQATNAVSTCIMLLAPAVHCVQNTCQ